MEKWFIKNKLADFKTLANELKVSEVLVRLMVNRGLTTAEEMRAYLSPDKKNMYSPYLFKDMEKAVQIISNKVLKKAKIRIVGDYDVDGVISTFILYKTLEKSGANVSYEIPDRINDGYGINISIIEAAISDGIDTIITCDNGIAAISQIEFAKENGLTVVILDHHDIVFTVENGKKEYILPPADAVINPHQKDCSYPFENICAGQVSYKFAQAFYDIRNKKNDRDCMLDIEDLEEYLGMASIATICDVMPLNDENRIFVSEGMKIINKRKNVGLRALMDACGIDEVKAYHLGFIIGPCINATGRLESAKLALNLFLGEDYEECFRLAEELKALNDERKKMTMEAVDSVDKLIKKDENGNPIDKVLVIYLKDCHESIAGIVAGRVREKYNRPAIVVTKGRKVCKASGRSIEEYNMFEEISKVRYLLEKFGGHPMAAGLSIKEENIEILKSELNKLTILTEEDLKLKCSIDIELPISLLNNNIIEELDKIEPYGKNNEKPTFAERNLSVIKLSIIGANKNVLKFKLHNQYGRILDGLYFGQPTEFIEYLEEKFGKEEVDKAKKGLTNDINVSLIYYPQINEYMGRKDINIVISHYK